MLSRRSVLCWRLQNFQQWLQSCFKENQHFNTYFPNAARGFKSSSHVWSCRQPNCYWHFGESYYLHIQCLAVQKDKHERNTGLWNTATYLPVYTAYRRSIYELSSTRTRKPPISQLSCLVNLLCGGIIATTDVTYHRDGRNTRVNSCGVGPVKELSGTDWNNNSEEGTASLCMQSSMVINKLYPLPRKHRWFPHPSRPALGPTQPPI
jgi:hypothetical protein